MRTPTRLASLASLALLAGLVRAEAPAPDALRQVLDGDPLELAATAHRLGDDAVCARLVSPEGATRLAAVRATPLLQQPQLALAALVDLAAGRDPDLAPAAARAIDRISASLTLETLDMNEVSARSLDAIVPALLTMASDEWVRQDIRQVAQDAAHRLQVLGAAPAPGLDAGTAP